MPPKNDHGDDFPGIARFLQGRPGLSNSALIWGISAACLAGGLSLSLTGSLAASLAVFLSVITVILALHRPALLYLGVFIWLPLLGFVRRLPPLVVDPGAINPLLIVGPIATGVLLLLTFRLALKGMTRLAWAVLAFNVLTVLSVFNPRQGGLKVGLAGLIFMLVPLLWFWIGRGIGQAELLPRILRLVLAVAVATSLYGLWQILVGFPFWDEVWIRDKGYAALNVRGTIRPFSTFSSAAEYSVFIAVGLVIIWSAKKNTFPIHVLLTATVIIVAALLLIATRSTTVLAVSALAVVFLAKKGVGPLKAFGLLAVALILFSVTLRAAMQIPTEDDRLASLIEHQLGGLARPFDPTQSTLGIHTSMVVSGVKEALSHPLGNGPGSVSLAGWKLGGASMDTEVDFSNAAVALGLPGLTLFSFIAVAGSVLAYTTARRERSFLAVAAVGILAVTGLRWLAGAQYAVAPLPWLMLGWLDSQRARGREPEEAYAIETARSEPEEQAGVEHEPWELEPAEDFVQPPEQEAETDPDAEEADSPAKEPSPLSRRKERLVQPVGFWHSTERKLSRLPAEHEPSEEGDFDPSSRREAQQDPGSQEGVTPADETREAGFPSEDVEPASEQGEGQLPPEQGGQPPPEQGEPQLPPEQGEPPPTPEQAEPPPTPEQGEPPPTPEEGEPPPPLKWEGRQLQPVGFWHSTDRALSRLIDIILAAVGLVVLSPILVLLAGTIRLSTGASGLFTQVRLGKGGRPFRLVKLRTLLPETPPQVPKRQAENMATRLGWWLRESKLDEAPQLWNVIKGDMALVGPRPIIPEEYSERSDYQRLRVRPGLTGLWQLSKARGHPFDENPEYDLFYLENRSLPFDLWIMWRTALLLIFGRETGMELAASLWEKGSSWRTMVPRAAIGVPARAPTWRPATTVLMVAGVGLLITLATRAEISGGMPAGEIFSALVGALRREGFRLLTWTLAIYAGSAFVFFILPLVFTRRPGLVRKVVWATGLFCGFSVLLAAPPLVAARGHLQQARESLERVQTAGKSMAPAEIESVLDSAQLSAVTARGEIESPLTMGARLIPLVRGNIQSSEALASAVSTTVPAVNESLRVARSMAPQGPGQPGLLNKGRVDLNRLQQITPALEAAAATARSGVKEAERAEGVLLPPLRRALTDFSQTGNRLANSLDKAAEISRLLPAVLGADAPRTYFLMIQNGAEQRATGGYLGAFAILRADQGQVVLDQFQSNDALPSGDMAASPSAEFSERYDRFDSRSAWHNINMTPDFPTASEMITDLWQRRTGKPLDGVFAVDAIALGELLKVSGPVSVLGMPEPVTSDNFVQLVLNQAYILFTDKSARVDVLLPIASQVWGKLLTGEGLDSAALVQTFGESFATKHMQVWTRHEQKALKTLGIDGGLKTPKGRDFLLVVGQNAAGNKIDFYAKRRIRYRVNIGEDGQTSTTAAVILENRAPSSGLPTYILGPFGNLPDPPGLNRSYVSLYVPRSTGSSAARLDGRPVGLESHREKGFSVVSKYVEVLPSKTGRLEVDFQSKVSRKGDFRLMLQHQPGLQPDLVEVSVKIPNGTVVTGLSPGMRVQEGVVKWRGTLREDTELYVKYGDSLSDRFRTMLGRPLLVLL